MELDPKSRISQGRSVTDRVYRGAPSETCPTSADAGVAAMSGSMTRRRMMSGKAAGDRLDPWVRIPLPPPVIDYE